MNIAVIVVCAGEGKRLGKIEKPLLTFKGKPLFYHSVNVFIGIKNIKQIILVLKKNHFRLAKKLIRNKKVSFVEGGKERKDSVYNGLCALEKDIDYVLIHDGARPFVKKELVLKIIDSLRKYPAVICGIKVRDTLKIVKNGYVSYTLKRDDVYLIQTPQGFKKELILSAYRLRNRKFYDDAQLLEIDKKRIKVVEGDIFNFKITYPQDILLAKIVSNERL
jgi:2-C-methyl-D-erythritol 4-phosphate cytidylyltransferase